MSAKIDEIDKQKSKLKTMQDELKKLIDEFKKYTFTNEIEQKVFEIQTEINKRILYVMRTYEVLKKIKKRADFLLKENNNSSVFMLLDKLNTAFLMLAQYHGLIVEERNKLKKLIAKKDHIEEENEEYKKIKSKILKIYDEIIECNKNEINSKQCDYEKDNIVDKFLKSKQELDNIDGDIEEKEKEIEIIEECAPFCRTCGAKLKLKLNGKTEDIFWGCPNNTKEVKHVSEQYLGDKIYIRELLKQISELKLRRKEIITSLIKGNVFFETNLRQIKLGNCPTIDDEKYINYFFQSLCIPNKICIKEYVDELLENSKFKVSTKLFPTEIDKNIRTIYSLSLRLLNRGFVLGMYEKIEKKISRVFTGLKSYSYFFSKNMIVNYNKKYLQSCKYVHQISIAILKMLEQGCIDCNCHLSLNIAPNIFSDAEKELLLQFSVEEVTELVDKFAQLYGIEINLNLSDINAASYVIKIGDIDDNKNAIYISDYYCSNNFYCSIEPLELIAPKKEGITEEILEFFLEYIFGFAEFRQGQFKAIRRALLREESIVLLPTGSGKSVIYQLASMLLPGVTVIISPLRALIEDQVNNLKDRGINNVAAIFSLDKESKEEMESKAWIILKNHSASMLYIAPERLQITSFRETILEQIKNNNFCLIAIDEAHCVSEWGHDFRASYLQIGRSCRSLFKKESFIPPIIALTGTASENVLRDVKRDLEIFNPDAIIIPPTFNRPELHYSVIKCENKNKIEEIMNLLDKDIPSIFNDIYATNKISGIIFTVYARKSLDYYSAWTLFHILKEQYKCKIKIGTYFSIAPSVFEKNEELWLRIIKSYAREFKDGCCNLLVATKAFGMGIDKSDIRYIIHNSLPSSIEQYYQEVGRAGRDRKKSICYLLFYNANDNISEKILNPNLSWEEFNKKAYQNQCEDDVYPLIYFHRENFKGTSVEKLMMLVILYLIFTKISIFSENIKISIKESEINYEKIVSLLFEKADVNNTDKDIIILKIFELLQNGSKFDKNNSENFIAKSIVRLVTLGIIKDYEFDYTKKEYTLVLGSIKKKDVNNMYLKFVEGCSIGRRESERKKLQKEVLYITDCENMLNIIDKYIDLVYETIEKGRRRALYSIFKLIKEASKKSKDEQDIYIREEINNYLVKDDTVEVVRQSTTNAGIDEIFNIYPLYIDKVTIDKIEKDNAKITYGATSRMLEEFPDHPGLLYLHAVTALKSGNFNNKEVVSDIIEAYKNSTEKYNIAEEISDIYFLRIINLVFNCSTELLELLMDELQLQIKKTGKKIFNKLLMKASQLKGREISEHFYKYLLLNISSQLLNKITGGK